MNVTYPDNTFGVIQQIKDAINSGNISTAPYPHSITGMLQQIRDLLDTDNVSTSLHIQSIRVLLQNIRDLLNTGNASTADYRDDISDLLRNIRDLLNTGNASVAGYQPTQLGLWQAIRDFLVLNGIPGGGGYTAKAVHFDADVYFRTESLIASGDDTGFCSYHYWFNFDSIDWGGVIYVVDPDNTYTSNGYAQRVDAMHWEPQNQFCSVNDSGCWSADTPTVDSLLPLDSNWHSIAVSVKTNLSAGNKIFNVYINDVLFTFTAAESGSSSAFTLAFNGLPLSIFDDGGSNNGLKGDVADFWFAPGQFVDFSVEANRRKFRDSNGKPVDLGNDGSTPTGVAPALFFSGNSADFGANKGSGGPFVKHGSGSLTNASTSPSD